jgi:hypothetical protein
MYVFWKLSLIGAAFLFLSGCGGLDSNENQEINEEAVEVIGAIQKGPFVIGSVISINELSSTGTATNATLTTQTTDDLGSFSFSYNENTLLQINASGYYRNEITGMLSSGIMNLSSIVQITDDNNQSAHVNILTHLISSRVLNLIKDGSSHESAISSATLELLSFLDKVVTSPSINSFSTLSLYNDNINNEGNAYLTVISALIYQYSLDLAEQNETNPDAELTLILNSFSNDISDGALDNAVIIDSLINTISNIRPESVQSHLTDIANLADSSSEPANINLFLDTDLDGIYNEFDLDDDGDKIPDTEDSDPYRANFIVTNLVLDTNEDTDIEITLEFNNPSGGEVKYNISDAPEHGTLIGSFPNITYSPNANFNGADIIKLHLSQGDMVSDQILITISVTSENDDPIISGEPDPSITVHDAYTFLPVVNDIDSAHFEFTIENKPYWLNFSTLTGMLSGTPTNDDAGTFLNVVITVSDGLNEASLPPFNLVVKQPPWVPQAKIPIVRSSHATAEADGIIYLFGGKDENWDSVFAFNPGTNSWESKSPMPTGVFSISAHQINGLIYMISGFATGGPTNLLQIYNPITDSWSAGTSMPTSRYVFSSSVVNGKIYVIGGQESGVDLTAVEEYDPTTDRWTIKSAAPIACSEASASTLDGMIYYVGGCYGGGYTSAVYIYNPLVDLWSVGTPMNHKRWGLSTSIVDGKLYALGGQNSEGGLLNIVEEYDPDTGQWQYKTPMSNARYRYSSTVVNDKIYVFGSGWTGGDSVEMYDPSLD